MRKLLPPHLVAILVLLVGVAIVVGALSAWVGPIVFWAASQFWYIPFEERKMEAAFDDDYRIYREGVRRWVGVR